VGFAVSALIDRAIDEAGLADVLEVRRTSVLSEEHLRRLRSADLLALGALADQVRAEEVGDEVRIYLDPPSSDGEALILPRADDERTGLELLREVAVARVAAAPGANIRVDWARCGLELAQVALGFGANEMTGFVATKRGLPIAEGQLVGLGKKSARELARVVKERELEGFVRRAGRIPLFVRPGASSPVRDAPTARRETA
jgi:2-iminoacetate synthase ThiH